MSFNCFAGDSVWKKSQQLEAKSKYQQAASVIESKAASNNEYAVLRYAYLKYLQGEYNDSIRSYKKAIELNSASIDARLGITLPLMAQQRWRQVKSYMLHVLQLSRWNYTAHVRLMLAEEGMRKWTTLEQHAEQLAKVYPGDATVLVYLARANVWQGDDAAAKAAYAKVLIRLPGHIEANNYINK